jgi:Ca-activated chloride channel family protein
MIGSTGRRLSAAVLAAGCCVSAAALAAGQGSGSAQQLVFRAAADAVRIDVSVRRNGRSVSGLRPDDFEVTDNGVAQSVSDLSFETGAIDVTVALDLSRSVSGDTLGRLRRGVDQLRSRLRPADRLKLVTFNMRVRRLVGFDDPRERTNTAIAAATAGGGTSLLDTLAVLLSSEAPADRRQLIIVFSDGADTISHSDPDTLLAVAARTTPTVAFVLPDSESMLPTPLIIGPATSGSPVPTVSFGRPTAQRSAPTPGIYGSLVAETGGTILQASSSNLGGAFTRLLDDFRSSYVLHYVPTGVPARGFHALGVRVKKDDAFDVRARRGYTLD